MTPQLPPLLGRLLLRLLLKGEGKEFIRGDIEEEYSQRILPLYGEDLARRWYWRQATTSVAAAWSCRRRPQRKGNAVRFTKATAVVALWLDVRYAVRTLHRRPMFTTVAVLVLGVGIGATTAIFSIVDAVLLRKLPYEQPDRLVSVWVTHPDWRGHETLNRSWDQGQLSFPEYRDWHQTQTSFEDVAIYDATTRTLTGLETPMRVQVGKASASLFSVLGVRPVVGRAFLAGEDGHGAPCLAIISYGLWQDRFGGRANAVGRTVVLSGESFTVVGVLPQSFRLRSLGGSVGDSGERAVWIPIGSEGFALARGDHTFEALGRLRPGVTMTQARIETETLFRGDFNPSERGANLILRDELETRPFRTPMLMLLGSSLFLLVIASVNVAGLLMGEIPARRREIATRTALGASAPRVVRQLVTESVVLGLAGSMIGVLCAAAEIRILIGFAPPLPGLETAAVNGTVLVFAIVVAVLTSLFFGVAPSLHLLRYGSGTVVRSSSYLRGRNEAWSQRAVVWIQLALTVVLLISGGLLGRSLLTLFAEDPGFQPQNVATLDVLLADDRYPDPSGRVETFQQMLDAVSGAPGVLDVSGTSFLPFSGAAVSNSFVVEGREARSDDMSLIAHGRHVFPRFHETLGIPVIAGRTIIDADGEDAPFVVVVSEGMARQFWPNESAVGARIEIQGSMRTIVGVVGDVLHESLDADEHPTVYMAYAQGPRWRLSIVARTSLDPRELLPTLRETVWSVDSEAPITKSETMASLIAARAGPQRFRTILLMVFGITATLLAAAGVYGITALGVSRRTRELGIRIALGARKQGLAGMIVRASLSNAIIGIVLGLVGALWTSRLLARFLFGVQPFDPITYCAAASLLAVVCVVASYLPARRIARVDPVEVLRAE